MCRKNLKITLKDNVAVMLEESFAGDVTIVDGAEITLNQDIAFAHKVALKDFAVGDPVYKYGEIIGKATAKISKGDWVHDHNIAYEQWK